MQSFCMCSKSDSRLQRTFVYPVASLEPPYPPPFCPVFIFFSNPLGRLKSAARGCTFCFKRSSTSCIQLRGHITNCLAERVLMWITVLQTASCVASCIWIICCHMHVLPIESPLPPAPPNLLCCILNHRATLLAQLRQQCMLDKAQSRTHGQATA